MSPTTGLNIRLLPLGDSITYGLKSSDQNGYRNALHKLLEPGNTVKFIGSIKAGRMADNDNEGHNGWMIAEIASAADYAQALPSKPNVIALHAGSNDIVKGYFDNAIDRLASLVDHITTSLPDSVLLLATIGPITYAQSKVNQFNEGVEQLAANRARAGKKVVLADMSALLPSDLADGLHPNDRGYVKMANAWYTAFVQAAQRNWIVPPDLVRDSRVSFRVTTSGFTDRYLRHRNSLVITSVASASSDALTRADATFIVRPGLVDSSCYSFESVNYPGHYLRHKDFRMRIDRLDSSDLFARDATFNVKPGVNDSSAVTLWSYNIAGHAVRHYNAEVWISISGGPHKWDAAAYYDADVTWRITDALS